MHLELGILTRANLRIYVCKSRMFEMAMAVLAALSCVRVITRGEGLTV